MNSILSGYKYDDDKLNASHNYLLPAVKQLLSSLPAPERPIFELGCGNGSVANILTTLGFDVTGIDASEEGISQAQKAYPNLKLRKGSAYDSLREQYGEFPIVLSLEVVEHLYSPREFAKNIYNLLAPGGTAIVSTPYHGYWKNLALAATGKLDEHFTALWDHGHIKFWSKQSLDLLLREAGFTDVLFVRVGRIPILAKSMIVIARKAR